MASRKRLLALPNLPEGLDPGLREWCEAVEERLSIQNGDRIRQDSNDRVPTKQDMIDAGIANAEDLFE